MNDVLEIFGKSVHSKAADWKSTIEEQWCPFVDGPCFKMCPLSRR